MQWPTEAPLMTLPNAILFPEAMLPLYIFEPRYRKMLADALHTNRMFCVGMQRPGRRRETPCPVAGLGLIRASVAQRDGTSHLVLQGLARVELVETVRYKPYRVQRIRALETTSADTVAVDALAAKVIELVGQRLEQGRGLPGPIPPKVDGDLGPLDAPGGLPIQQIAEHMIKLENPDRLADLVSYTLLSRSAERQVILETPNLEQRLKYLVHFLIAEVNRNDPKPHE